MSEKNRVDAATKPATKTSAVLAVYHDGVLSPTAISNEVKSRYGIDVSVGSVSGILSTRGLCRMHPNRRRKARVVKMSKPAVEKSHSGITPEMVKHAAAFNRACGGDMKLAQELLAIVQYVGQQFKQS